MNIDRQTLAELAARLKHTSDAAVRSCDHLATLDSRDAVVAGTVQAITSLNKEIAVMQRILNFMWLRSVSRPPGGR
jgi:hypothetical protein